MAIQKITVRGARQHNLKNISVEIPRNTLTVITGLSGSGKSSLAFDTIYAEGQRRYVETLSAYARQFLDQMERPDVDSIDGLSPAIAIEQKTTSRSPRSTVGTITEIYDYLRLLYATVGAPHCPQCGRPISRQAAEQIVSRIMQLKAEDRVMILAPIVRGRKGEFKKELEKLAQHGFVRARIDGELRNLEEDVALDKRKNHTIEVVVDRLLVKPGIEKRLENSLNIAMKLASGLVIVSVIEGEDHLYSSRMACPECGISVPALEPRSFSFNSVYGACPECNGLGSKYDFDPAKVIVDWSKPLLEGALGPGSGSTYLQRSVQLAAAAYGFDLAKPFEQFSTKTQNLILYGPAERDGKKIGWAGVLAFLKANLEDSNSDSYREWLLNYMSATVPGVQRRAAASGEPGGEGEWDVHRRLHRVVFGTRRGSGAQDKARRARREDSRTRATRDRGASAIPQRRGTELYFARPFGGNALRRRRPAHPAGHTDRVAAAWRALRARRALHRIASPR